MKFTKLTTSAKTRILKNLEKINEIQEAQTELENWQESKYEKLESKKDKLIKKQEKEVLKYGFNALNLELEVFGFDWDISEDEEMLKNLIAGE